MAEEITKYVTKVEFQSASALKRLNQYEQKLNAFNKRQAVVMKSQAAMRNRVQGSAMGQTRGGGGGSPSSGMKASKTALADMLRKEEAAAREVAKQKNFNNNLELKHIREQERARIAAANEVKRQKNFNNRLEIQHQKALEKSKETLKNSLWYMKSYESAQERLIIKTLKESVNRAKSAKEVRAAAATARRDLSIQRQRTRALEKQNFLMRRMRNSSEQMVGNMASAFAIGAGVTGITRVGQQFESVNNTMLAVSTNSKEAGENFQFIRDEAYRLGLGLAESGQGFAKLVAARGNMSLEDTKEAFLGVAEASTLLGLSTAESTRAINALMQIDGLAS